VLVTAGFVGFSIYQYHHLPWIDFREWKIGTDLTPDNTGKSKVFLTFKNKETGEEKEYLSPDYPWQDSVWMASWEFVSQRVDDSEVVKGHSLVIQDVDGNDMTATFVENPEYQFLLIVNDLLEADPAGMDRANELFKKVNEAGYSFILVTGSLRSEINKAREYLDQDLEIFSADDIELKMMIRANPGLILLKDSFVIDKWHYNDFPDFNDLEEQYFR
jgi:hypothetical protein